MLSPIHSTTVAARESRRRRSSSERARSADSCCSRPAAGKARGPPRPESPVRLARVASHSAHRAVGDDDDASAERVDALRELRRAGDRRRGPFVHPGRPTGLGVPAVDRARGAAGTRSCRAPSRRRRESRPTIRRRRRASAREVDRRRVDTSAASARDTRPTSETSEYRSACPRDRER